MQNHNSSKTEIHNHHHNNSTNFWHEEQLQYYRIVVPLMMILCLLACLANFAILCLTQWVRRPLFPILKLTLGLAAADAWSSCVFGIGLFINSYLLMVQEIHLPQQDCILLGVEVLRLGSMFTAVLHLLLLAITHYFAIANSVKLNRVLSDRTVLCSMIFSWLLPPIMLTFGFSVVHDEGFQPIKCSLNFLRSIIFRLFVVVPLLVPVVVMAVLYYRMAQILRITEFRFHRQHRRSNVILRKRRTMTTTLIILGSFLLAWVPNCVIFLLISTEFHLEHSVAPQVIFWVTVTTNLLMLCKFVVNPVIYASRVPELREALRMCSSIRSRRHLSQLRQRIRSESWHKSPLVPRTPFISSVRRISVGRIYGLGTSIKGTNRSTKDRTLYVNTNHQVHADRASSGSKILASDVEIVYL